MIILLDFESFLGRPWTYNNFIVRVSIFSVILSLNWFFAFKVTSLLEFFLITLECHYHDFSAIMQVFSVAILLEIKNMMWKTINATQFINLQTFKSLNPWYFRLSYMLTLRKYLLKNIFFVRTYYFYTFVYLHRDALFYFFRLPVEIFDLSVSIKISKV